MKGRVVGFGWEMAVTSKAESNLVAHRRPLNLRGTARYIKGITSSRPDLSRVAMPRNGPDRSPAGYAFMGAHLAKSTLRAMCRAPSFSP